MIAGAGSYTVGTAIYASVLGAVKVSPAEGEEVLKRVEVLRKKDDQEGMAPVVVPQIGSIVIAKVINITSRTAKVDILSVDGTPVRYFKYMCATDKD
jgi:exosome complex RNA-binding protein Csl4